MSNSTNVVPFDFEGNDVRVVEIDGEAWFVAKDIATVLGYTNPQKAVRDHCKTVVSLGVNDSFTLDPQTKIIEERDVYRLIMRSKLPSAERFEEWVVGEVLPSIRKTGSYQVPMTREQELAKSFLLATEVMEEQRQTIEHQAKKIEQDTPKVEFYETVSKSKSTFDMGEVAKMIGVMGRNKLFDYLRNKGVIRPKPANNAYQTQLSAGRFQEIMVERNGRVFTQTRITTKGVEYIINLLVNDGYNVKVVNFKQ